MAVGDMDTDGDNSYGVLFHNKRYYAAITVRRKKYYSKCFKTLEEAAAARKELERIHWGVA
jgi:hypothetical protein